MAKRQIGDIFYSGDLPNALPDAYHSYWKITDGPRSGWISFADTYPVIKCSKYGKEYDRKTGFSVRAVDSIPDDKITRSTVGVKADTTGVEIGRLKRRLGFLEKRNTADQTEMAKIHATLDKWCGPSDPS